MKSPIKIWENITPHQIVLFVNKKSAHRENLFVVRIAIDFVAQENVMKTIRQEVAISNCHYVIGLVFLQKRLFFSFILFLLVL